MDLTVTNPKSVGVSIWFPSGNDLIYTMSSTASTTNGFYFLVEVYVNGNKAVTLRKYPIAGVLTQLNVKDIVNAYISSKFTANNSAGVSWHSNTDYAEFYISVTEVYNGDTYDNVTTLPMFAWDAAAQFAEEKVGTHRFYRNFAFDVTYSYNGRPMGHHNVIEGVPTDVIDTSSVSIWKTLNQSKKAYANHIVRGDKRQLSIFCGENISRNTEVTCLIAYGFDDKGRYIKKGVKTISATAGEANRHWVNYTLTGGTETWDDTYTSVGGTFTNMFDCKYIYYCFAKTYNANFNVETKASYGVLYEVCDLPESYSVLYKSYEGGWCHIQLNRRATEATEIKTITKQDVAPYKYAANSRLVSAVKVLAQGSRTYHTDWVNEQINEEIQDMLVSPQLYIQHYKDGVIDFTPVTLADATYTTKELNDVNLFNYELNFIESYEKNTILR